MIARIALVIALLVLTIPAVAEENESPPVRQSGTAGIPVDAHGGPIIDPTENVKALTAAGLKTEEQLRTALSTLLQSKIDSIEKLNAAEIRRIDQIDKLRSELNDKLSTKEADRINAMRLLDVGAAADLQRRTTDSANNLQTQTATLATDLRTQTALLAENLRTLVLNTATQQAAAAKQTSDDQKKNVDDLSKRLTTVESSLSEGRGKQAVSDPALSQLVLEVQKLSQRNADQNGVGQGRTDMAGWIAAGVSGVLIILIASGGLVVVLMRQPSPVPAYEGPIYATSPRRRTTRKG